MVAGCRADASTVAEASPSAPWRGRRRARMIRAWSDRTTRHAVVPGQPHGDRRAGARGGGDVEGAAGRSGALGAGGQADVALRAEPASAAPERTRVRRRRRPARRPPRRRPGADGWCSHRNGGRRWTSSSRASDSTSCCWASVRPCVVDLEDGSRAGAARRALGVRGERRRAGRRGPERRGAARRSRRAADRPSPPAPRRRGDRSPRRGGDDGRAARGAPAAGSGSPRRAAPPRAAGARDPRR